MRLNIILFTLAAKPETYWEISHQVKRKTCGQSNINLANLPLGFPESVHLIHMCETCFVFSKESLKASRFKFTVFFFCCQQAQHRDLQNITQQVNCLSPFVPLRKLTETLNGETILRDISLYRDVRWSPQQVHI